MSHEESIYPDPFTFKPERFFDENGKLKDEERILAFGFGRRYFSSFTIANHSVLTTAQSLCWRAGRKCNCQYLLYILGVKLTPAIRYG